MNELSTPVAEAVPATPCPGQFQWSAFGATYSDTACQDGVCLDLDRLSTDGGVPCPFCRPADYFDYEWGGNDVEPTCSVCLTRLPVKAVRFIDGPALTWTVACTHCKTTQPGLMCNYEPDAVAARLTS